MALMLPLGSCVIEALPSSAYPLAAMLEDCSLKLAGVSVPSVLVNSSVTLEPVRATLVIIGVALGLYFTPVVAREVLSYWPLLIAAAILAMLLASACAWLLASA